MLGLCCCGVQAPHCSDFSCGIWALSAWSSVVGLCSCSSWALEHRLGIVVKGLSCSKACGIFPHQGSNPCLLHWQADSLPLSHQGSPALDVLQQGWGASYLSVCLCVCVCVCMCVCVWVGHHSALETITLEREEEEAGLDKGRSWVMLQTQQRALTNPTGRFSPKRFCRGAPSLSQEMGFYTPLLISYCMWPTSGKRLA